MFNGDRSNSHGSKEYGFGKYYKFARDEPLIDSQSLKLIIEMLPILKEKKME